jgi:hypothetical protein
VKIHTSLACYPGVRFPAAARRALAGSFEPLLGRCPAHVIQLVPQCVGGVNAELIHDLKTTYPGVEIRLHANVQIGPRRVMADVSGWRVFADYFSELRELNRLLGNPVYTAHAGRRREATLAGALRYAQEMSDAWECPVAIEGHYPTARSTFLIDSWSEYKRLFQSGVPYVVDLSHLNIVAHQSGRYELALVQEALSNPKCLEVHVSANNGDADSHLPLCEEPWWWPALSYVHEEAVVFTEGRSHDHD